jgi:outer membrane protein assembly factor BamB
MSHVKSLRIAAIVLIVACAAAAWADWPQFMGPSRDGVSTETGLMHAFPAGGPPALWSVPLGAGFGGAAIYRGEVFVTDRADNAKDVLVCLDFATGKEKWRCAYDAPGALKSFPGTRCTPAVDDRFVFCTGEVGFMGCIDKTTHQAVWTKNLVAEFGARTTAWGYAQCPLLYKDWVIVAPQGAEFGVVALDKATGKEAWHTQTPGGPGYVSPRLATIGGVEQLLMVTAGRNGGVMGLDPASGKLLWVYNGWHCSGPIPEPTVIDEGRLFISAGYGAGSSLFKVEKQGETWAATEVFSSNLCAAQIHPALLYKDHLYANSFDNQQHDGLVCMDLSGTRLWRSMPGAGFDRGALLLADGMIIILDANSGDLVLVAPQPEGYKELGRAKVVNGNQAWGPMALTDGKLLVRSQSELKCLDLKAR